MITGKIKTQVDNIWNAFAGGGIANPAAPTRWPWQLKAP